MIDRSSAAVLVLSLLVAGASGAACESCSRAQSPVDVQSERLKVEAAEDGLCALLATSEPSPATQLCALRARIRALEIAAGVAVPDAGSFAVPAQGNSVRAFDAGK